MNPLLVSGPYDTMYSVIVQCIVCTIQFFCFIWAEAKKSALELFGIKTLAGFELFDGIKAASSFLGARLAQRKKAAKRGNT